MVCQQCGLEARCVESDDGMVTLEYDHGKWDARCPYRHLDSAALCHLLPSFGIAGQIH
jgi:hypothetical protein